MHRITVVAGLLGAWVLGACSPVFNWREVRVPSTSLKALLPCKPDQAAREVPLLGQPVRLSVLGCETGGATFAVMTADVVDAGRAGEALAQWKLATLATLRGSAVDERAFLPSGGVALRESLRMSATGQRGDGRAVQAQAAYFARSRQVFHAVIYADRIDPTWADAFFTGLAFE